MTSRRYLFLGGRAHGERLTVPDSAMLTVKVPKGPFVPTFYREGEEQVATVRFETEQYRRRRAFIGPHTVTLYVLDGLTDEQADYLLWDYLAGVVTGREVA